MVLISVIIPVYNVEKYLSTCLNSVINQTYTNLEIICVEDCSTDKSREILENYAKKDPRIKVIYNKENSKLGPTRNVGFFNATGDYIHFLDSDDWLEHDAYEQLVQIINTNKKIDIIYFYLQEISNTDKSVKKYYPQKPENTNKVISIDNNFRKNIEYLEQVWNKIYSKDFLQDFNIIHNDYACFEDMEFSLKCRIYARNIYYLNNILINYRTNRKDSLTGKYNIKDINFILKSYLNAEKWCQKDIDWEIGKHLLNHQFDLLKYRLFENYKNKNLSYRQLAKLLRQIDFNLLKDTAWHVDLRKCKEISVNPEWYFLLKTYLRNITKEKAPKLHKLITDIRKKIIKI